MADKQIHILGIAPYEGMKVAMERIAESYPNVQVEIYTGNLEEGAAIVKSLPVNGYDCIISRGGTAHVIRKITDTPVVEIHLSVYDMLRAIKLAETYSDRFAIVGFPSITEAAYTLSDLLQHEFRIITIQSMDSTAKALRQLKQDGFRMVISDMVTHDTAREMGMEAFLITSGAESLHAAFDQAIILSAGFRRLRQENLFLRTVAQKDNGKTVVLNAGGEVVYSVPVEPSKEQLDVLRSKLKDVSRGTSLRFYYNDYGRFYNVNVESVESGKNTYYIFHYTVAQIPIRSGRFGLRTYNRGECEQLFQTSFFSVSGAMGETEAAISSIALVKQPVMILGEAGTGKEQVARALYLRSPISNKPFILVDCTLMNDKGWSYLLNHFNSPLNDLGNTIHFQNVDALSETWQRELMSAILESSLAKRNRLIFSCVCPEGKPVSESAKAFISQLGCITLKLPSLRNRADEIPSLASLYLGSLNMELGKQIAGFEPNAMKQLQDYEWPSNYTQFKHILYELVTLSNSAYIRSSMVAELLSKERSISRTAVPQAAQMPSEQTLDQIITDAVRQAVAAHGGNQSAAAKQLGISRTTLWRYMSRREEANLSAFDRKI